MSKFHFPLYGARLVTLLAAITLVGCFEDDKQNSSGNEAPLSDPFLSVSPATNYPYHNDLELSPENIEMPDARQKEWLLGNEWRFLSGDSKSPNWHMEFGKPGSGLGSFTEGTALLETVISIPATAVYPTFSFWHQLHLEKDNHSVVVEAKVVTPNAETTIAALDEEDEEASDWFTLMHLYVSDNSENYTQVSVDLTPYVGQSLQFRLRTVERSEKAEEKSNKSDPKSGAINQNGKSNKVDSNARGVAKSENKPNSNSGNPKAQEQDHGKNSQFVMWRIDDISIGERDTDKDGVGDVFEIRLGTDPNDPASVPVDNNNDGIPDAINAITGTWNGPCRYVGGGEYLRQSLFTTEYILQHRHESSAYSDCHAAWNTVAKNYSYSLINTAYVPGSTEAKLDLELKEISITPSTVDVATALNRVCSKKDFIAGSANDVSGVTCSGGIAYPQAGILHYDLLRQHELTIWLGEQQGVSDSLLRSTRLDIYTPFQRVEAVQ